MLISHSEIIEKIKADKNLNFVAFVRTPWHALGCNAALLKLKQSNDNLNGIILFSKESYKTEQPLVSENNVCLLNDYGIKYSVFYHRGDVFSASKAENIKTKILSDCYFIHHKKGRRKIYVLCPMGINDVFISRLKKAIPDAYIINIVVDEGLGIYMRSSFNWAVEQYYNTKSIKSFARFVIDIQKKRLCIKSSMKRNEYIDNSILVKKNGKYQPNEDIIDYYKQAINSDKISSDKYKVYNNAVVISAQLYFENGRIKDDADLKLYKEIISGFSEKGISVVFKPHPRDKALSRYDGLNCFVDTDNTVSQEIIMASLDVKPAAVLSFTSTSLITSKLFYGVKAASLNELLKGEDVQITLQNEFSNFKKAFGSVVAVVKTTDELLDYICSGE